MSTEDSAAVIPVSPKETFWQKQFSRNITKKQIIFDVLFGIVIPIVLLIFDPGVFTSTRYADASIFWYTAIGLGIAVFTPWLFLRKKAGTANIFFGVVFLIGSIYAGLLAVGD